LLAAAAFMIVQSWSQSPFPTRSDLIGMNGTIPSSVEKRHDIDRHAFFLYIGNRIYSGCDRNQ
jgi:hypothetical protein